MSRPTVLVTGCGAPGFPGTLWSLRQADGGADVEVVGADARPKQAGRYLSDAFVRVPKAGADGFVDALVEACRDRDVDVVLPQVTGELPLLAEAVDVFDGLGTAVSVSSPASIARASDTGRLTDLCEEVGVPTPETLVAGTDEALVEGAERLGYPDRRVVVKPPNTNGSRGMRILDPDRDRKRSFYADKPTGVYSTLPALRDLLGGSFPRLLVTEYLPGEEYTVDAFRSADGEELVVVPRRRDEIRSGISFRATVVQHEPIVEYSRRLAERLDLVGAFGFQFKEAADGTPKILECNPRVQGTMVTSTIAGANVPLAAVRDALGDPLPPLDPDWGRSFYRYWAGIGVDCDGLVGNIGELG